MVESGGEIRDGENLELGELLNAIKDGDVVLSGGALPIAP